LAVTKSDLADAELIRDLKKELPDIPSVFISSHKKLGLNKLKSMIWEELNRNNSDYL